ncbi:uncharacterized protein BJ212DRAFT_1490777 [Suillus subaureus]|uniref:Uncharacterized protein n=1 Tax=Suillus subaureus TaxID=48587 RepID=A0A9P7DGM3_9AGAM|nr:uncharacterized protein BJ212DRAFT_1490777 [Suillus subaureus]KAG1791965.1 hypothetical protein BJ212DRAFT_1490777 [Suillus subaureus]
MSICSLKPVKIVVNPLATLAQAAVTAKLIPLPPSPIPAVNSSLNLAPEKIDNDSAITKASTVIKAKPAKVKKMHPGPKENGCDYFNKLTLAQVKNYSNEVNTLLKNSMWSRTAISEGTVY